MRPLVVWLLGLWLGVLLASWVAATLNFRTVDRVLGPGLRPEVSAKMSAVPADERRMLLRHLASEINRWVFRSWAGVQMVLGLVLLALSWRLGWIGRALMGAALLLVVVQGGILVPPIVELGRAIDFVPRPLPPDIGRRFGLLHAAYVGSDLVKALLLAAAAWVLGRRL